jgi:hypothetical protein
MDAKTLTSLEEVVNYLHVDERKHFEETEDKEMKRTHIYHNVHRLAQWLDDEKNGKHLWDCGKGHKLCRHCEQCVECDEAIEENATL